MLTVAQKMQNILNFMVRKLSLQEIATLAIIQEISPKIWSLPDYPGELNSTDSPSP